MTFSKLIAAAVFATTSLLAPQASASILDDVKNRGVLNCGTDNTAPGFGYLNTKTGQMEGMDVDFCKAVAAAVLGDSGKVKFVIVTDKSRFNAVQTNQVDVVFAHSTLKPGRESAITVDFLPITFYDGNGVMVKKSAGIQHLKELDGATICTTQGSGTETTLAGFAKANNWSSATKILTFENLEKLFAALNSGRCNAMSTDKSALAAWRGNSPNPDELVILPEALDKSPFAGFVVANDSKWRNALRWIVFATFQAEESGITSANLDESIKTSDPFLQKFLGVKESFGPDFGIPPDFVQKLIRSVGNYGEIYDRNIGPGTPYFIERKGTPNAQWTAGGAVYSPPWI
jgi:general L-amino acid transport system substrate-binding protein